MDRPAQPQSSKTTATFPVHDPELEQDHRAFTKLERLARSLYAQPKSMDPESLGLSHTEMERLNEDFNWIAYYPYPGENPILLSEIGLCPYTGKVLTLGEALVLPALDSLHPQLVSLQRYLRALQVFRDDRRQVVLVGGIHGFHVCSWVPVPNRPYSQDGVPLYDFVAPLTGLPWEPCGQLDLGSPSKLHPFLDYSDYTPATKTTDNLPDSQNSEISCDLILHAKTLFESSLDAFTAFSGEACFPVLHDSGASITLHPRSFRERLLKKGVCPKLVGERKVCTEGFTGLPIIATVRIFEFPLRLWGNSVPVNVRSHEFPDHQTNVKTLLFGRDNIWNLDWFIDRAPDGTPSIRSGQRFKPMVRAKEHLFQPLPFDLRQPAPFQRPDQLNPKDPTNPEPQPVGNVQKIGGWCSRPSLAQCLTVPCALRVST